MGPSPADNFTVLYSHKFSPFAQRAHIGLLEKGIPFHPVIVDLNKKPKELLEVNPVYGKVPSLLHNGNSILESRIILEYLDEAFPDTVPLMPKDPLERSKYRFWADYIYKGSDELITGMQAAPGSPEHTVSVEKYVKYVKKLDVVMSEFSKEGPYFCGEKFGYLDVVLAPHTTWFLLLQELGYHLPDNVPRLQKCMKAISERKSVKELLPKQEEAIEYWDSLGYRDYKPVSA